MYWIYEKIPLPIAVILQHHLSDIVKSIFKIFQFNEKAYHNLLYNLIYLQSTRSSLHQPKT